MSAIDTLTAWFFDRVRTPKQRWLTAIVVLVSAWLVDDLFCYSYYYRTGKQVENHVKLTKIVIDKNTDPVGRTEAMDIRREVSRKEPVTFRALSRLAELGHRAVKTWGQAFTNTKGEISQAPITHDPISNLRGLMGVGLSLFSSLLVFFSFYFQLLEKDRLARLDELLAAGWQEN